MSDSKIYNQVGIALNHLIDAAEHNHDLNNLYSSIAEIEINGVEYQIQVCFAHNKRTWVDENGIGIQEIVKIHD